ncbi:SPOR domain-containing protein, partial [Rhodoferax saidenbachensis]
INVGLFAEETNARNAHTKLLDAGLVAFTEEMKTPKGKRIRVRVGPFEAIGDADAAAERIRGLGLDAELFQR